MSSESSSLSISVVHQLTRRLKQKSCIHSKQRLTLICSTSQGGASVALTGNSVCAKFVKRLDFVGTSTFALRDGHGPATSEDVLQDVGLPVGIEHILSNLDLSPTLEEISVQFALREDSKFGPKRLHKRLPQDHNSEKENGTTLEFSGVRGFHGDR
ncbi:hypothetical protein BU25DRAFT_82653 [Macroventuria anomochaeta]|uniref:Uncharacterized protein n=1 Tax=Macroventuria anomochaeta TaxID=301207 RepID=A0ACB6SEQ4_9PLEO|nr:uncharacterized protein BU25DRAFT_82653 [Macroventuria anomochaeta]KAF2632790.1 hypothetical protein BU25DRAFT_82653 [Macroventuria anomochaeta]